MKTNIFLCLCLLGLLACTETIEKEKIISTSTDQEEEPITTTIIEDKLEALGIELPTVSPPVANYVNAVTTGKLVFLAGKGPRKPDGTNVTGKVGADLTVEEGYEAARLVAINQIAALKAEIGNLDRVNRVVKVLGMVNSTPDFENQPEVINGFSDLIVEIFGDKGKHARAAVGMGSLPRNIAVEIEMIVELK